MSGRMITVDERWKGNFGIGRYSQEVLSRLTVSSTPLSSGSNPASPWSLFDGRKLKETGSTVFYTPGYNVLLSPATQIVTIMDLINLGGRGPRQRLNAIYFDQVIKPKVVAAGKVITISETSVSVVERWLGRAKVDVINAGIGCSEIFAPQGSTYAFESPYFLYVGNTKSHKNASVVFRALASVPNVKLLVVSGEQSEFSKMARDFDVLDRVNVLKDISDHRLAELYRGATATLLPSLVEGFGLPAAESISCGTPVIYWKGCLSVREICGDAGVAVESATDARQWGAHMKELLARPLTVRGDIGRYSWNSVGQAVDAILGEYCA